MKNLFAINQKKQWKICEENQILKCEELITKNESNDAFTFTESGRGEGSNLDEKEIEKANQMKIENQIFMEEKLPEKIEINAKSSYLNEPTEKIKISGLNNMENQISVLKKSIETADMNEYSMETPIPEYNVKSNVMGKIMETVEPCETKELPETTAMSNFSMENLISESNVKNIEEGSLEKTIELEEESIETIINHNFALVMNECSMENLIPESNVKNIEQGNLEKIIESRKMDVENEIFAQNQLNCPTNTNFLQKEGVKIEEFSNIKICASQINAGFYQRSCPTNENLAERDDVEMQNKIRASEIKSQPNCPTNKSLLKKIKSEAKIRASQINAGFYQPNCPTNENLSKKEEHGEKMNEEESNQFKIRASQINARFYAPNCLTKKNLENESLISPTIQASQINCGFHKPLCPTEQILMKEEPNISIENEVDDQNVTSFT